MSEFISDIKDSTKTFIDDRLKNPYITTVLAVWIYINRVLVYGVFNFSNDKTFEQKLSWISKQLNSIEILGFKGFWYGIVWAAIWGVFSMLLFNLITGAGKASYKWVNKASIWMIQKVEPSKWVSIIAFDKTYSENEELVLDNKVLKKEVDRLENQIDSHNEKVNQYRIDLKEKDVEISELNETTIENSKNVGRFEAKIKKQEADISDQEHIIQNHITKGKMNSDAIAKLEEENNKLKSQLNIKSPKRSKATLKNSISINPSKEILDGEILDEYESLKESDFFTPFLIAMEVMSFNSKRKIGMASLQSRLEKSGLNDGKNWNTGETLMRKLKRIAIFDFDQKYDTYQFNAKGKQFCELFRKSDAEALNFNSAQLKALENQY